MKPSYPIGSAVATLSAICGVFMDKHTLFVKTEKGRDAMARRLPELGPRLRSMLILVDGKRNASELDKLGAALGDGAALLEQLLAHGWTIRKWTARKGYAVTEEAVENSASETLWCSPHCVPEVQLIGDLFASEEAA